MLVLKRKEGESIVIGDDIELTINEISSSYVKLSINAPRSMKIVRKELLIEIEEENLESIKNLDFIIKSKE
ncbi:carbon storage regulator [Clostridium cylindrosporum]|uniref:Translational regulator CsrA n=1 Tax=Clostridium cylindrosporum DSM 605 TaxID=1121307 RepID=A0A0J8D6H8_CLOCY|nr:carbon storage regulator [Clostridium cylindrosporum]KMT21690.1 carbon storage regulator CsrA [Clostridium cylindrosporum DSM 605]